MHAMRRWHRTDRPADCGYCQSASSGVRDNVHHHEQVFGNLELGKSDAALKPRVCLATLDDALTLTLEVRHAGLDVLLA
jgi:hypothetical protein